MRLQNPYLSRQTIGSRDDFYGRSEELRAAFSVIGSPSPQCVSVVGERRSGKSSFLCQIARPDVYRDYLVEPERYVFLYLDLQAHLGLAERHLWLDMYEELREVTGGPDGIESTEDVSTAQAYRRVTHLTEDLQADGRAVVLLLDEFEAVLSSPSLGLDCLGRLRALTNNFEVGIVTATRLSLADACHEPQMLVSPFFNVFGTTVVMGQLDDDGARALVHDRSRSAGCPLIADARWLRELSGDYPYLLQICCAKAFDARASASKLRSETLNDIERVQVEENAYAEALPLFQHMWDSFSEDASEVVVRAACGKDIPERLAAVAGSLQGRGVLAERGILSSLFKRFVQQIERPGSARRILGIAGLSAAGAMLAALHFLSPAAREVLAVICLLITIVSAVVMVPEVIELVHTSKQGVGEKSNDKNGRMVR